MLIVNSNPQNIAKARKILKCGGVIIYPTDTLYGLGADIFNKKAIQKIFAIKGRDFSARGGSASGGQKPISVMVTDWQDIKKIAVLNKRQEKFMKAILPGPYTIILKKKKIVNPLLTARKDTIGIRMPDSIICQKLTKNLPITTTSANLSGQKTTLSGRKLAKIFGNKVDLILLGKKISGRPSTIVDLTAFPPKILIR